ncbi:carboxypeptidase B-like [Drosophila ficusphila]|uniref:carboxypeptidase B-like n=1 Tax=Drosophila ficusphila TaxID=30025 RepID=UPI0007E78496|nr:carboxypeptidase B-like [Drosophila ficusphila]
MLRVLCLVVVLVGIIDPFVETKSIPRVSPNLQLDAYLSYDGIMQYLDQLAIAYPDRVTVKKAGSSYENRDVKVVEITNGDHRPGKRVILLDAALHAREWMTPAAALYVIHQLVVEFQQNSDLLADLDWHIVPLANPDGYEYSRNVKSMWRNTRRPTVGNCIGSNLNRNFEVNWGIGFPELKDPCDENYAGPEPFSEVEARIIRDIMQDLVSSKRGVMYLSLHTANRSVFYPWFHKEIQVPNYDEHVEIANFVSKKILQSTGTIIKTPQYAIFAGVIGGTSVDYAYNLGFPLSFIFEISGTGEDHVQYKFFPPPQNIRRLADEGWIGIRAFAEKVMEKYPPSREITYEKQLPEPEQLSKIEVP